MKALILRKFIQIGRKYDGIRIPRQHGFGRAFVAAVVTVRTRRIVTGVSFRLLLPIQPIRVGHGEVAVFADHGAVHAADRLVLLQFGRGRELRGAKLALVLALAKVVALHVFAQLRDSVVKPPAHGKLTAAQFGLAPALGALSRVTVVGADRGFDGGVASLAVRPDEVVDFCARTDVRNGYGIVAKKVAAFCLHYILLTIVAQNLMTKIYTGRRNISKYTGTSPPQRKKKKQRRRILNDKFQSYFVPQIKFSSFGFPISGYSVQRY